MEERFWLQDDEAQTWEGRDGLEEIVKKLREGGQGLLPFEVVVSSPQGDCTLTIRDISDEGLDSGDLNLRGTLGELGHPIQIWWNEEVQTGYVDTSCYLDGYLERFAQEWDFLPPEDRSLEHMEIHELSELGYDATLHLADVLHYGDADDELAIMAVIHGDNAAEALNASLTGVATSFIGRDSNDEEVDKFAVKLLSSRDFAELCHRLGEINKQTELIFDITIFWEEPNTKAA